MQKKLLLIISVILMGFTSFFFMTNDIHAILSEDLNVNACIYDNGQTTKELCTSCCNTKFPKNQAGSDTYGNGNTNDANATCIKNCESTLTDPNSISCLYPKLKTKKQCESCCQDKANKLTSNPLWVSGDGKKQCVAECERSLNITVTPTPEAMHTPLPTPSDGEYWPDWGSSNYVCGGIISDRMLSEIVKIYKTISVVMVVAVVVFGAMDFINAVTAGNSDAMQKATKRFTNRLIIAILIVMLPVILSFILTLFGDANMKTCLDKINI